MSFYIEPYAARRVSRETISKLECFAALVQDENGRQNLISKSTIDALWERHIADSAQLARFEPAPGSSWIDIGSGAGFPGMVVACLVTGPVTLVEPRRLRAAFLTAAADELGLTDRVRVLCSKARKVTGRFDVITARAVGGLEALLEMTSHLSHRKTVWVLPKGRSAKSELADARRNWQCDATGEVSMTDPESEVLVLRNVRPKGRG